MVHQMALLKRSAAIVVLLNVVGVSMAEVPPLSSEVLESMPYQFQGTVRSVESRTVSSNQCRIEKQFNVELEGVRSFREVLLMPPRVTLEGEVFEYKNGCVGSSGASTLARLHAGQTVIVHAMGLQANRAFRIEHYSQIEEGSR
jgi:hypothetical protein